MRRWHITDALSNMILAFLHSRIWCPYKIKVSKADPTQIGETLLSMD